MSDEQTTTGAQDNTVASGSEQTQTATETKAAETTQETTKASTTSSEASKSTAETKDTKAAEKTAEKGAEKAAEKAGAPEAYTDFKLAEGVTFQPEVLKDFQTFAKAQNWTQEQAQANVDFFLKSVSPQIVQQQAAEWQKTTDSWAKESEKTYGKEGIEAANVALGRFSDLPEFAAFTKMLQDTGFGKHPGFVGVFKEIHDRISESAWVNGKQRSSEPLSLAERLYGK